MKKIKSLIIFFIVLSFLISIVAYKYFPDQIVTHWNIKGNPDGYMNKIYGLFILPGLSLFLYLLFILLIKIDPLKKNIEKFKIYYESFILLIIIFLFYVYLLMIFWNLGYKFNFNIMMIIALSILFIYIGYILPKLKRNWFIGIRTPWTLSNDKVWNKTHKLGGYLFILSGLLTLLGIFLPDYAFWFILGPVIIFALITIIYSYFLWKKITKK